ncbi:MAG: ABC transporter ATP-binding protein, partial [Candidatus Heimdallarchaeaceae archaeon]
VAFDILLKEGFTSAFNKTILIMLIQVLISWLLVFLGSYIWSTASFRAERDFRQEFYEVVTEHSMAFHDTHESGQILSIGMNEISQVRLAYHPGLRMLLNSLFTICISIYFIWTVDTSMGAMILIISVIYLYVAWLYAAKVSPIRRTLSQDLAKLSASSQEVFRGIEVVRSFDNHKREIAKFEKLSEDYALQMKKEGYLSSFYWPAVLTIVATGIAFIYGLFKVSNGFFTPGQLSQLLIVLLNLMNQNLMIPQRLIMLQAGLTNASRIWNIMSYNDPLQEPEHPIQADWNQPITFDHVTFAYPGSNRNVLQDISFTIPVGARVVLVGGPGAGKSTILKLLLRLYEPTKGKIMIGDCDLQNIYTKDVRKQVTLVEQDIFLFSNTIRNNIAFAKADASLEEIKEAARRAQIADFIESLPDKYNTVIGERGVTLSGGQRQRIAIARALLSNPRLLLLDDSTSNVDIKTEIRLRRAMEELMKGRTSIIVTQRITTLIEADMIIVLDSGHVVDIGTHNELLERCAEYQFMCKYLPVIEEELKLPNLISKRGADE